MEKNVLCFIRFKCNNLIQRREVKWESNGKQNEKADGGGIAGSAVACSGGGVVCGSASGGKLPGCGNEGAGWCTAGTGRKNINR